MTRPPWDFEYRAISSGYDEAVPDIDVVVALSHAAPLMDLTVAAHSLAPDARIEALLARSPLFWYRVKLGEARSPSDIERALAARGLGVRYVTSTLRGSLALGEPLDWASAEPARSVGWAARAAAEHHEPASDGRWLFYEAGGIDVDRAVCGTGEGTRLAVIDDEARDASALALDKEVFIGTLTPSRSALHGSLMVAWAVGVRGDPTLGIAPYTGIAPDASPRLYLIPKPGRELVSLPCAIVRAVDDGADVVVCATSVEGTTSPLLDDALAFANRLGRGGRGTAVVLPTGREVSSPKGSVHASLTLALGEATADPRALCVAPSGRNGGWFLWPDKRGKLRPFANRGPSIRVAAPGDDMSYPFAKSERLGHAESSGASAIAAGVALLVLSTSPELSVGELYAVLASTARPAGELLPGALADAADTRPDGVDHDGHDAKCGYGRLSARRACLGVADPVTAALVDMGEEDAAREYLAVQATARGYSAALAAWAARAVRRDPIFSHSLRAVLRHLRLVSGNAERRRSEPAAAFVRALAQVAARLEPDVAGDAIGNEIATLRARAIAASRNVKQGEALEAWCFAVASRLWAAPRECPLRAVDGSVAPPVGGIGRSA